MRVSQASTIISQATQAMILRACLRQTAKMPTIRAATAARVVMAENMHGNNIASVSVKLENISNLLLTIAGNIIFYVLLTRGAGLGLTRLSMNSDFITASSAASTIHPAQLSARLDPKKRVRIGCNIDS